jgi:hypothetical protein
VAGGVFWRRTVPAVGLGIVAGAGIHLAVQTWMRPNFIAPISYLWTSGPAPYGSRDWVVQGGGRREQLCLPRPHRSAADLRAGSVHLRSGGRRPIQVGLVGVPAISPPRRAGQVAAAGPILGVSSNRVSVGGRDRVRALVVDGLVVAQSDRLNRQASATSTFVSLRPPPVLPAHASSWL